MPKPYPQEFRDAGVRPGPGREELAGLRQLKRRYRLLEQGRAINHAPSDSQPKTRLKAAAQLVGGSRIGRGR